MHPGRRQDKGDQGFFSGEQPGCGAVDAPFRADDEDADDTRQQHAGHAYDGHQVKFPGDDQGTDTIDKGEGKGDDEGPYRADMPEIFSFRAFQGIGGPRAAIVQNQHREEDVDENPQQGGL